MKKGRDVLGLEFKIYDLSSSQSVAAAQEPLGGEEGCYC